jgi:YVTN family beta-propeller protein
MVFQKRDAIMTLCDFCAFSRPFGSFEIRNLPTFSNVLSKGYQILHQSLLMKTKSRNFLGAVSLSLLTLISISIYGADGPYHLLKTIPVGGDGGWDYLSVDEGGRRLYVSHGTVVVVIDIDKDAVVGEIADTPGVHGLAPVPDLQRGFTSNGRENKASMVDLKSLQTLAKVETGQNPDGMLYEPGEQQVYMFNGRSQSATVIDAKAGKVVATIPLGGKPEFGTADSKAGRVYDNLEDKSEVVAIDTKSHKVADRWPISPGEEASGMAIDLEHHRLFLGCGNKLMVMMDSTNGKVVGSVAIGQGVDANAFDPGTQLAFASCGDGTVTIAHEDSPEKLTVVQTLTTEPRARTMTIDPKTHRIYLASAKFEAPTEQPAGGQRQRPRMVPGSFKILVYGTEKGPGQ